MTVDELIETLRAQRVAQVRSVRDCGQTTVYTFEGRLPEFPFRSRLTSYELVVKKTGGFVDPDEIEFLLVHFWQGQIEMIETASSKPADDIDPQHNHG